MNSILSEFRHELDGKQMWAQLHQNGDGYSIQCFIDNIYQGTRYILVCSGMSQSNVRTQ